MKKFSYPFLLLLSFAIISCSNNTQPSNPSQFEISVEPLAIEININPDSLQIESSPNYSIDYSALKLTGTDLLNVKYYYPTKNLEVKREFVVSANDSFKVEIINCKTTNEWIIDLGNYYNWINSDVILLRTEEVANANSTLNYKFIFKVLKEGKGYICFIEKSNLGEISSNESHGLLVGYSTNARSKVLLNINEIIWKYNTKEGTFSTVSVYLNGTTNMYRLRGMTFGDGELSAIEIPIKNYENFETELPVAFSHVDGITLKTNSELLLYGTVGLPKVITLINPKNN